MRTPTKSQNNWLGFCHPTLWVRRRFWANGGAAFRDFGTVRQKRARSREPRLYTFRQLARYSADAGAAPRSPQNPSFFFYLQPYTGRPPPRGGDVLLWLLIFEYSVFDSETV